MILLKGQKNHSFRGLYSYDPELDQVMKVHLGTHGPDILDVSLVQEFYKYDSGSRGFKTMPMKSFGRTVHAVSIGSFEPVKYIKRTHKMQEATQVPNEA